MTFASFLKISRTLRALAEGQGLTFDELTASLDCKRSSTYDWIARIDDMLDGELVRPTAPGGRFQLPAENLTELVAPVALDFEESVLICALLPYSPLILPPSFLNAVERVRSKLAKGSFRGEHLFAVAAARQPKSLAWSGPQAEVVMEDLFVAADKRLLCEVVYTNNKGEAKRFDIRPLAFVEKDGRAYLLYAHPTKDDVRSLRPEAIQEVKVHEDQPFERPAGFDANDFLDLSFGTFFGDTFTFSVRFTPNAAPQVARLKLARTQTMVHESDGSLLVEVTCAGRESVLQWILGFGADARVVSPADFVDEVKAALRGALELY